MDDWNINVTIWWDVTCSAAAGYICSTLTSCKLSWDYRADTINRDESIIQIIVN